MHHIRKPPNIVNRAKNIARMCTGDQAGLVAHQALQSLRVKLRISLVGRGPPLERQAEAVCDLDPGANVGFMVDL